MDDLSLILVVATLVLTGEVRAGDVMVLAERRAGGRLHATNHFWWDGERVRKLPAWAGHATIAAMSERPHARLRALNTLAPRMGVEARAS